MLRSSASRSAGLASGAVKGVYCSHLRWQEQLRSTSYIQRDYTFKNPPHHLQHRHSAGTRNGVADAYPIYDYPGRYKHDDSGKPFIPLNNIDPERDVRQVGNLLAWDGARKLPEEGFVREWPPKIEMTSEVVRRVDALWHVYGLPGGAR